MTNQDRPFENEPLSDFSREQTRQAMQNALREVADHLGRCYPLVIGGQSVNTDGALDSVNPSHCRQIVGHCGRANSTQAQQAVAAAVAAFSGWRDTDPARRAGYLFEAGQVMRRRRFELAAWEVYECGKQWREADADVAESIDYCDYYGREMLRLSLPRRWMFRGKLTSTSTSRAASLW